VPHSDKEYLLSTIQNLRTLLDAEIERREKAEARIKELTAREARIWRELADSALLLAKQEGGFQ